MTELEMKITNDIRQSDVDLLSDLGRSVFGF